MTKSLTNLVPREYWRYNTYNAQTIVGQESSKNVGMTPMFILPKQKKRFRRSYIILLIETIFVHLLQ